ncbi:MAG: SDR family NAD(P)-dependent oxidoreductase [Methyloligellaceae bacterium]
MQLGDGISAIVTGGASGLGAATARVLAAEGVKVAIFDLDEDRGAAVAAETGGLFCRCDVTSVDGVAAALEQARAANGPERINVNCAGIAIGKRTVRRDRDTGAIEPHDLESFSKVIQINLIGTFNVLSQSAAGMLALDPVTADGGRGVIVNTSSVAAQDGQLGQVAYAASKGGVAALTLPVARDLSRDGVRVVTIMPGLFDTPMFATLPDDVRAALGASVPFPSRLGDAGEYAALVRHICENDMLNGECIRLDGAVRLAPK